MWYSIVEFAGSVRGYPPLCIPVVLQGLPDVPRIHVHVPGSRVHDIPPLHKLLQEDLRVKGS